MDKMLSEHASNEHIAKEIRESIASQLSIPSLLIEIAAVTHSMNQLFVLMNETLERDRQFTADVAHELNYIPRWQECGCIWNFSNNVMGSIASR
ncbi:MAG: hypothetical protein ACR5LD_03435 [Symbiopectobacterium sp.]